MKTILNVQNQIVENENYLKAQGKLIPLRRYNTTLRNQEKLKEILRYLETKPNETFIQFERKRLERIIASKEDQYENWVQNHCPYEVPIKSRKTFFNKETGIFILKRQLKNIKFILSK